MPEVLWKAYIDFEISEGEGENVRSLYGRLLERTNHVKVWISFAQFEASEIGGGVQAARKTFQDGYVTIPFPLTLLTPLSSPCSPLSPHLAHPSLLSYNSLKSEGLKEERVLLLEAWKAVEEEATKNGQEGDVDLVICKFPRKIKMRRMVTTEGQDKQDDGSIEWEEYYDYHFPDDEKKMGKLLCSLLLPWPLCSPPRSPLSPSLSCPSLAP
jgi:crooked neck